MVLVKYIGNGIQQWNRSCGRDDFDDGSRGVNIDSSGNIYVVGDTRSHTRGDPYILLVKYDGNGIMQWNRTWGGNGWDVSYRVAIDLSGNIYLAGTTNSFGVGENDMVLVKFGKESASTAIQSYNIFMIIGILSISSFFLVKTIVKKGSK